MIQISTFRHWFQCAAITVKDDRSVHIAFALTQEGARRRLLKTLDKEV